MPNEKRFRQTHTTDALPLMAPAAGTGNTGRYVARKVAMSKCAKCGHGEEDISPTSNVIFLLFVVAVTAAEILSIYAQEHQNCHDSWKMGLRSQDLIYPCRNAIHPEIDGYWKTVLETFK